MTACLWYSTVRDNGIGIRVPNGRAGVARSVRIEAAASIGLLADGAGAATRLEVRDSTVSGAAVGISAQAASLTVSATSVDVPVASTGILATGTTYHQVAGTDATLRGGGRAGSVGIVIDGAHPNGSAFDSLATSVRLADSGAGNRHSVSGSLFAPTDATAPVELETSKGANLRWNYVACPETARPTVRGSAAGAATVTPIELQVTAPAVAGVNSEFVASASLVATGAGTNDFGSRIKPDYFTRMDSGMIRTPNDHSMCRMIRWAHGLLCMSRIDLSPELSSHDGADRPLAAPRLPHPIEGNPREVREPSRQSARLARRRMGAQRHRRRCSIGDRRRHDRRSTGRQRLALGR